MPEQTQLPYPHGATATNEWSAASVAAWLPYQLQAALVTGDSREPLVAWAHAVVSPDKPLASVWDSLSNG